MEDIIANFGKLHKLFDENFMEYTSYVIKERAIPDMSDGFKPVQRRILQTLYNMDDGTFFDHIGSILHEILIKEFMEFSKVSYYVFHEMAYKLDFYGLLIKRKIN